VDDVVVAVVAMRYGTVATTIPPVSKSACPTIFEWLGGEPTLERTTRIFYEKHVPADPLLAPLFAGMAPDHPIRVARWLGEVFGGPKTYSATYGGYPRMLSRHIGKASVRRPELAGSN
jgi:truncated hemoglobin YjbI